MFIDFEDFILMHAGSETLCKYNRISILIRSAYETMLESCVFFIFPSITYGHATSLFPLHFVLSRMHVS